MTPAPNMRCHLCARQPDREVPQTSICKIVNPSLAMVSYMWCHLCILCVRTQASGHQDSLQYFTGKRLGLSPELQSAKFSALTLRPFPAYFPPIFPAECMAYLIVVFVRCGYPALSASTETIRIEMFIRAASPLFVIVYSFSARIRSSAFP
jgi:hypothetical protein